MKAFDRKELIFIEAQKRLDECKSIISDRTYKNFINLIKISFDPKHEFLLFLGSGINKSIKCNNYLGLLWEELLENLINKNNPKEFWKTMKKSKNPSSPYAKEIFAIILFAVSVGALLSLLSFNAADPSFSHYRSQPSEIHNWLGVVGSFTADLLLQSVGLGSFLVVVFLFLFVL